MAPEKNFLKAFSQFSGNKYKFANKSLFNAKFYGA